MKVINRADSTPIETPHGSKIYPVMDRSNSRVTSCSIAEELLPPGCAVRPHYHREIEEIYYIQTGHGLMTVADEQRSVGPGDAVHIPRGQRHSLENTGGEEIRLLLVCGPAFFREDENQI